MMLSLMHVINSKCTTINRKSSKQKLDTSLAKIHETKKIKNVCINGNDNDDMQIQDEIQLNSGK